eukprot:scaffold91789_cov61-Phaeocystis_antarctica.AAC.1
MATVYPAARNLCAAVTYTRSRNCSLPNRAGHPHEDIEKNKKKKKKTQVDTRRHKKTEEDRRRQTNDELNGARCEDRGAAKAVHSTAKLQCRHKCTFISCVALQQA